MTTSLQGQPNDRAERVRLLRQLLLERFGPHIFGPWLPSYFSAPVNSVAPAPLLSAFPSTLPTGVLSLDLTLGGGLPRRRLIELAGPPYTGKRTLAAWFIRAIQQTGGWVAYLDAAHSLDLDRFHRWGINVAELLFALPRSLQEALEITRFLLLSQVLDLVLLDLPPSYAMLPTLERGLRQLRPLLRSTIPPLPQATPSLLDTPLHPEYSSLAYRPLLSRTTADSRQTSGTTLLVIRDRRNGPGLQAATIRIRIEPLAFPTPRTLPQLAILPTGLLVRLVLERGLRWPPHQPPVPIELNEQEGVRAYHERIDLAQALGLLTTHPLGLVFRDTVLGRTREAAALRLKHDPTLWTQLEEEIRARWLSLD